MPSTAPGIYVAKKQPLSKSKQAALLAACRDDVERLIVTVLLDVGLRLREWVALRRGNLIGHKLKVGNRKVTVPPRSLKLLKAWFKEHAKMPCRTRSADVTLRMVGERCGILKLTPDVLRRSFAANCVADGWRPEDLQVQLDASVAATTRLYLTPKRK